MSIHAWQAVHTWDDASAVISAVSSSRGADIATANEALTITVDDSASISAVTVNGESCTSVSIVNGTTVTCTCPLGFGAAYGTSGNVVVNNGVDSAGYSVTLEPPEDYLEDDFTVAYASLGVKSPFAGNAIFNTIVSGDSCLSEITSPSGLYPKMAGDGVFTLYSDAARTIVANPTVDQIFNYYFYDISDDNVSPTINQINAEVIDGVVIFRRRIEG